jgi:hypothetical protein
MRVNPLHSKKCKNVENVKTASKSCYDDKNRRPE